MWTNNCRGKTSIEAARTANQLGENMWTLRQEFLHKVKKVAFICLFKLTCKVPEKRESAKACKYTLSLSLTHFKALTDLEEFTLFFYTAKFQQRLQQLSQRSSVRRPRAGEGEQVHLITLIWRTHFICIAMHVYVCVCVWVAACVGNLCIWNNVKEVCVNKQQSAAGVEIMQANTRTHTLHLSKHSHTCTGTQHAEREMSSSSSNNNSRNNNRKCICCCRC